MRALGFVVCVLSVPLAGCGAVVSGGDESSPALDDLAPAVAMTGVQHDMLWGHEVSPGDAERLYLVASDVGVSCTAPNKDTFSLPCGGHWSVTIALPPEFQTVGVYNLDESAIWSFYDATDSGSNCVRGGGTALYGTIEIVAIDDAEVHFRLTIEPIDLPINADATGEYVAARCP